ncbi:MAG: hypothetical protein ACE5GK_10310 [Nitrospiria bacterium]
MTIFSGQDGVSIVGVILMMLLISVMGQVLVSMVGTENFSTVNQMRSSQAHYIAEAGIERAKYAFANGTACAALSYNDPLGAGNYATNGTLYNPVSTTLSAAVVAGDTILPLVSIAGYAPHGRVAIEAEEIDYATSTTLPADCLPFAAPCVTGAQRGVNGTTAATHASGIAVAQNQCLIRSTGNVSGVPVSAQRVIEVGAVQSSTAGTTVQSGSAVSTANGTLNVVIPTPVTLSRSYLIFNTRHNSERPVGSMVRGRIANASTLEFVRVTDEGTPVPITIQWHVVEHASGVNVQRGSVNQTATTINVPITPVASLNQAFVTWSKTPAASDTDWDRTGPILGELTTLSNLQFRVNREESSHTIWWQVIEFTNPADILVQKGSTSMDSVLSTTVTLGTAVDVDKTFVLVGYRSDGGDPEVGRHMLRARLTNSTTLVIDRSVAGGGGDRIDEILWQAVQLNNASTQHGSRNFPGGSLTQNVPISAVDTTRAIAFASVQPVGGQNMGRSPYEGDDIIGVGSVTMALQSNQIVMQRNNAAATADIGWFVVEFAAPSTVTSMIDWRELF